MDQISDMWSQVYAALLGKVPWLCNHPAELLNEVVDFQCLLLDSHLFGPAIHDRTHLRDCQLFKYTAPLFRVRLASRNSSQPPCRSRKSCAVVDNYGVLVGPNPRFCPYNLTLPALKPDMEALGFVRTLSVLLGCLFLLGPTPFSR